jgi:invasion protein IalB
MYHIGYFNNDQSIKALKLIEVLPPNVQIPAGTAINSHTHQVKL